MPSLSFSTRITAYFGGLFLFAIGGVLFVWYFGLSPLGLLGARDLRLAEAVRLLELDANHSRIALAKAVEERRSDLSLASESLHLGRFLSKNGRVTQQEAASVFERMQRAYPDIYIALTLVDPGNFEILTSSHSEELGKTFQNTRLIEQARQPGVTELIEQGVWLKEPVLLIARQVVSLAETSARERVGILVAAINIAELLNLGPFTGRLGSGLPGRVLLLNAKSEVLFSSTADVPGFSTTGYSPSNGFEGTLIIPDQQGVDFILVYRYLQLSGEQGLTLLHYVSKDSALSSINEQIQSVIVVGLSITLLGLVFVGLLARRLTSPLWQLTRVAGQFGSGDLAVRAKSSSGDTQEVVELAAAFNKMAYSIEQVQHELEVKVRELGTSNTSLQATLETLQRTQNELIQREKLASLGALVAGVAHEMNTPLGNSVTISSALVEDLNVFAIEAEAKTLTRSGLREFIAQMRDGLDILVRNLIRANTLVGNFKRVAADQSSELRRPFDLAETVHELVPTIAPQFKHTPHRILVDIPSGLLMDSFPGPLGQVLANLVLNALLHAFSNEMQGEVRVTAEKTLNEHIILRVSDNGRGVAPENLPRIFDPFFTTKLGQGGSGLGLHIVFNIVTATLGGSVRVDSKLGEGTCFTLDFPCVAPKPEQ